MKEKTDYSTLKLLILGILAGAYIGFGAEIATLISIDSKVYLGYSVSKFLTGAAFSVGLMLVLVAGAELFTGNNLICLTVFSKKCSVKKLLKNWGIVYIANLIGSLLLIALIFNIRFMARK